MSWALAEFDARKEGKLEGIAIGEKLGFNMAKIETAKNAIKMGLDENQVSLLTGLSIETITELKNNSK